MKRLEQIRDDEATKAHFRADFALTLADSFRQGFDLCLGLELHIKFLDWAATNGCWRNGPEGAKWYSLVIKLGGDKTTKELFEYWLENIYKIENQ